MKLLSLIKQLVDVGIAPRQISKPSNVTRRDFLKACGITAASVYMGGMAPRQKNYTLGIDYSNGKDYSAVRGVIVPNLLTDEAMYLPSAEEVFNRDEAIRLNKLLFQKLASVQPDQEILDAVNDFTRAKLREEAFFRRIIPPVPISNEDLDQPFDRVDIPETSFRGTPPKADNPLTEYFSTQNLLTGENSVYKVTRPDIKPVVISNQHFKLKVEGTHANQTIADKVAAHFGSRAATPEQIATFVRDNVTGPANVSVRRTA